MSLSRLWQATVAELASALRSRRAVVVLVLYLAASLLCMNGAISVLGKMETQLAEVLQLPKDDAKSGVVSATLWRSEHFQRIVKGAVGDSPVYDDICGRHPAELLYAFFAFMYIPLLTILISANRVADDLRSGSVRYMITRVTRLEWSFGKYLGLSLLLAAGLLVGALAAWGVAAFRLAGTGATELLLPMLEWSGKAWFVSLAWLGLSLGVSHFFAIIPKALGFMASRGGVCEKLLFLDRLFPGVLEDGLWRSSFLPVASSAVWLVMVGLMYFSAGYARFAKGDAR